MLPFAIGAVSAVSSLVGDLTEQSAAKKAKEDAINAYKKLLIPTSETETRADRAGDTLYTKTMSELNSGAFAARGALNPETLKTIAYTKMAGSRAETEQNVYDQDFTENRQIQARIAQAEATPIPQVNPLNWLESGAQGYLAGTQLEMAVDLNTQYASLMQLQKESIRKTNNLGGGIIPLSPKPDVIPGNIPGSNLNFGMTPVNTPQKYDYDGSAIGKSGSGPINFFGNALKGSKQTLAQIDDYTPQYGFYNNKEDEMYLNTYDLMRKIPKAKKFKL